MNNMSDQFEDNEIEFSKYAASELKNNAAWAAKLLEEPQTIEILDNIHLRKKDYFYLTNYKHTLFKIRFAYLLYLINIPVKYSYQTTSSYERIDFKTISVPGVFINLASIESRTTLEKPIKPNNSSPFRWSIPLGETDLINMKHVIMDKIIDKKNKAHTFAECNNHNINMVILNVKKLNHGLTNVMQYYDFLYRDDLVLAKLFGFIPPQVSQHELDKGIFCHEDISTKLIQEQLHAIGFINEENYNDQGLLGSLNIFHNPKFFSSSYEFHKSLPRKLARFVPDITVF